MSSYEDQVLEDNEAGKAFLKNMLRKHFVNNDLDLEFLTYASWNSLELLPGFFRVFEMNFAVDPFGGRGWLKTYCHELGAIPETMFLSELGIRASMDYLWQRLVRA